MTTDKGTAQNGAQNGAGDVQEAPALTLPAHARALAAELSGGPVAATLLALAQECERLEAEAESATKGRDTLVATVRVSEDAIVELRTKLAASRRTELLLRDAWRRERGNVRAAWAASGNVRKELGWLKMEHRRLETELRKEIFGEETP